MFRWGKFISAAGVELDYKIILDGFDDGDWDCFARLIAAKFRFGKVIGVPTGGQRLAEELKTYVTPGERTTLVVDDVLTTGKTMTAYTAGLDGNVVGVVVISRVPAYRTPPWIYSILRLADCWEEYHGRVEEGDSQR